MTDERLQNLIKRWGQFFLSSHHFSYLKTSEMDAVQNAVVVFGLDDELFQTLKTVAEDVPALLHEVQYLRGQLSDLCLDSEVVRQVMQLREELAQEREKRELLEKSLSYNNLAFVQLENAQLKALNEVLKSRLRHE